MSRESKIKKRKRELLAVFASLPEAKKILLSKTIDTVAFMDIQMEELEKVIGSGEASTPDKQLYASTAKTRDTLMRRLIAELPVDAETDDFDDF